ncbi:MAG: hypothetical protein MK101_04010 [Phycisphaerales bacterium]|nr:hypothetical protein [Phycisphaerales bacterium]
MPTKSAPAIATLSLSTFLISINGALAAPPAGFPGGGMADSPFGGLEWADLEDALFLDVPDEAASIQAAVDSVSGSLPIIRVAAGEYHENVVIDGKGVTIRSLSGDTDVTIYPAVDGAVFTVENTPEGALVELQSLEISGDPDEMLPPQASPLQEGRGVWAEEANLHLYRCRIINCAPGTGDDQEDRGGGGVYAASSTLSCTQCEFSGCQAEWGGAIFGGVSNVSVSECIFAFNLADQGGAVAVIWSSLDLERNSMGFSLASEGGHVAASGSMLNMSRCVLYGAEASWGGGVWTAGTTSEVDECQFSYLSANEFGDVWYDVTGTGPAMLGSWFCGSMDTVGCPIPIEVNYAEECDYCDADTNRDFTVDVLDLVDVLSTWGTFDPITDLDFSGDVDIEDLTEILTNFGECNGLDEPVIL